MADTQAAPNPNAQLNVLSRMPSPRGKNALRFRGKDIEDFLTEYEHAADHANLTDEKKCEEIRIYFAKKEKRVIDVLDGFIHGDWRALKRELRSLYTSSAERKTYQPRDIQRFIARKRKITKLTHFDTYRREFLVITSNLEARNALSGYDRNDYFWSGIQPESLRDVLENELRTKGLWVDLTLPPPMNRVIEVATKFLDRDAYLPRHIGKRAKSARDRKRRKNLVVSDEESSEDEDGSESSSSSAEEDSSSDEEEVEVKRKAKGKRGSSREDVPKESKSEEKTTAKSDPNVQSNIDDLAERFKRLELQLGERGNRDAQAQKTRATVYCVMCGKAGHVIRECPDSKFFLGQGICRMDVNNRVVMSDGSALPRAEGDGGAAKVIFRRMATNTASGPTATSASNVEVVGGEAYYNTEPEELAVLGRMEFEVLPAERGDKSKKAKPYDRQEPKKVAERTVPEVPKCMGVPPNRAYVELPPTILKRSTPAQPMKPTVEDDVMGDAEEEVVPIVSKGKEREQPAVVAPVPVRVHAVPTERPRPERVVQSNKPPPKFVVRDPKASTEKQKGLPSYKYASELMNGTDSELVFKRLLDQPVTMKLGEVLGSSFELGRRFQTATKSQRFPTPQAKAASLEVLREMMEEGLDADDRGSEGYLSEAQNLPEFTVDSGEASPAGGSTEELHAWEYQMRMQDEYERQFTYPEREVNLAARPHEYRAMVTARLSGRIGESDYTMLVDSGSELNIMTLQQAQELALPIDDSGNSWTLKGISGHTMGLEGICWNVPVRIGGIDFPHNFFVTRLNLGNKDMVLGQPWLFSHSTRIDYVHEMGVTLQLWENGDRKGRSVLINLPLVKAPRNVMPISLRRDYESYSAECTYRGGETIASPGDDPSSKVVPTFMNRAIEAVRMPELDPEKPRPVGLNEDLILQSTLASPFFAEAVKKAWFAAVKTGEETLVERIEKLKKNVGISPIYESEYTTREVNGAKYKPVARKVVPVSTQDPESVIPLYRELEIGELPKLPVVPTRLEDLKFTERLNKERISSIVSRLPAGFLTKSEVELLIHVIMQYEGAIAFTDLERGSFRQAYYPDYVIRTVPHKPWQKKPIKLPQSRREEVIKIMKTHMASGRYEPSSASYRSTFFAVEKKGGALRVVHDLQPLNAVTIRDATLPPRVDNMIESFSGRAIYGLFDLKAGYDTRVLSPISRDLTSFYVEGMGLLRLTCLPQGHTNSVQEFQRCTQHMIGPLYPERAEVFIDDCAAKGPRSKYNEQTIPGNEQIRVFIWEYAHNVQELLARMRESGATVAGSKMILATPRLQLLGAEVALDGAHVSHEVTAKLAKWPTCRNPTEVRGFLGTVGVVRRWIRDFAKIAKPLTALTRKMAPHEFEWTEEAQDAMDLLKHLASVAVPVQSLDYELARGVKAKDQRDNELGLVSVHVDSSTIGVGWMIAQHLEEAEYPIVFGSITFNDRESHYSQPKLKLYGVF